MQQRATTFYQFDDQLVRVPNSLTVVFRQPISENAALVDVAGRVESVFHSCKKILSAVRWRSVDHARACVHGDVICEYTQNFAIKKRMLEIQAFKLASGEVSQFTRIGELALLRHIYRQLRGNDVNF